MKRGIIFILLHSISLAVAGQPADSIHVDGQAFAQAEKLFAARLYDLAWTEYQRALFFTENRSSVLNARMGYCRYFQGNLEQAFDHFRAAEVFRSGETGKTGIDSQRTAYCFLQAEIQIIRGSRSTNVKTARNFYSAAFHILTNTPVDDSRNGIGKKTVYLALTSILLADFDEARRQLSAYAERFAPCRKAELLAMLNKHRKKIRRANPDLAGIFSLILPGSGQFFAGRPLSGLNSLALNGSVVFLLYRVSVIYSPEIAILTLGSAAIRYYVGGSGTARKQAYELNKKKKEAALKELSLIIESPCH